MASKRDLVVNDLARYEKRSDRLVLEDYSHCEVPAGCGGGILRWIDPTESLPLTVMMWSTGKPEIFFDGSSVKSGRVDARAGRHVLAARVAVEAGAPPQIGLAIWYLDAQKSDNGWGPHRSHTIGRGVSVLSGAGAEIVSVTSEPVGDAWREVDFDASGWAPLGLVTPVKRDRDWRLNDVTKRGAKIVGLASPAPTIWVRCAFDLDLSAGQGSSQGGGA